MRDDPNQTQGEVEMSIENDKIIEKFPNGPAYLAAWNKSADLRDEFAADLEAFCHYSNSLAHGQVKVIGGAK